jgi:hypothetical protein
MLQNCKLEDVRKYIRLLSDSHQFRESQAKSNDYLRPTVLNEDFGEFQNKNILYNHGDSCRLLSAVAGFCSILFR